MCMIFINIIIITNVIINVCVPEEDGLVFRPQLKKRKSVKNRVSKLPRRSRFPQ